MTTNYDEIKYTLLPRAYNPAGPVTSKDMFQGRKKQLERVLDSVFAKGQSIIIYGERGVGKTSMASVVFEIIQQLGKDTPNYWFGKTNCSRAGDFKSLWHEVFKNIRFTQNEPKVGFALEPEQEGHADAFTLADTVLKDDITQSKIVDYLKDKYGLWIFDEFNLLAKDEKAKFSDLMKALSDANSTSKVVLVGVADDVNEIIESHESVERCTRQVPMPRMNKTELEGILSRGENVSGMEFTAPARSIILRVSQGFPYITHYLGIESSKQALDRKVLQISKADVDKAISSYIDDAQESLRETYRKAIYSPSKNATYDQVLLACAISVRDEFGMFRLTDVANALTKIRRKKVTPGSFTEQLGKLCDDDERGNTIVRKGRKNSYVFKFQNPLLQPYVILCGLKNGDITNEMIDD